MTNEQKLYKSNIYDLLCRIDKGVKNDKPERATCVIELLAPQCAYERCDLGKYCPECIAKWLNEEARP